MGYGMMGGFGGFGWIFQIVVLLAVVYLVVYSVRTFSGNSGGKRRNNNQDAQQILAERFARGEISAEEYKEMKEHLQ